VLFEKHYCGLIGRNACDLFWEEVQRAESPQEVKPIFSANKFFFMHIQVNKLFFVAVAHQETDALFTIEFLNRFVDICKYYFGASTPISEALVKEHFVTVYQVRCGSCGCAVVDCGWVLSLTASASFTFFAAVRRS
jgi:hypothetical protein